MEPLNFDAANDEAGAVEPETGADTPAADDEAGGSRLPFSLREQFYRAFTPGVLGFLTTLETVRQDNP